MAKAVCEPRIDINITFSVSELEAAALVDLAGYGTDPFIKAFYEHLGKSYMQQHEQGLRTFLSTISEVVGPGLTKIKKARELLKEPMRGA